MDSEADCGNWWGFSHPSWWWKSKDYTLQSSLGRIREERRHLGSHHVSTGIYYHGKIVQEVTCERSTKDPNRSGETGWWKIWRKWFLTVNVRMKKTGYPTHQTDGSVPHWCSTSCVHSVKMRICHPISEHVQSGAALNQRWTWSQRTRRSIGSNASNGERGTVGSCNIWQYVVVSRMEHSCLWQHVADARCERTLHVILSLQNFIRWVWLVWCVSKRFVNEIIMIIIKYHKKLDYQRAW